MERDDAMLNSKEVAQILDLSPDTVNEYARKSILPAIKKGRHSPKRPVTLHLTPRVRALLPDSWFQKFLHLLGVPESMRTWKGRSHA